MQHKTKLKMIPPHGPLFSLLSRNSSVVTVNATPTSKTKRFLTDILLCDILCDREVSPIWTHHQDNTQNRQSIKNSNSKV